MLSFRKYVCLSILAPGSRPLGPEGGGEGKEGREEKEGRRIQGGAGRGVGS